MKSVFQRAMGDDFDRLHPQMRRRLSVGLASDEALVGHGTMDRVWRGARFVAPFLAVGSMRNILVPRTGRDVPFTIVNLPYTDDAGREAVTFVRTFAFPGRPRRFDAAMVYSEERGRLVDYLGTHQHLACDLHVEADGEGGAVIRSDRLRLREGPVDVAVPSLISGDAVVRERYDPDTGRFRVSVRVSNRRFGPLFGYEGSFAAVYRPAGYGPLPAPLRPRRQESRV
ncbi:DUF4166 domain-containing protein [Nocardiopsis sp. RSe5-2]|uniref:DUF4166 domain-containing protein n=1 Tax=Nocardiopsis endophytica TaxID=3018445 RepID=A0ABT4U889_9ACTN|nr:DUF4166 domain-containing protein [Nocardiopsis endophytica]MDA2813176.1 DUF4166 domain-containing protein [Nocardiopsis endophytica]